jgi:SNF2 family DNA or RNA helicase
VLRDYQRKGIAWLCETLGDPDHKAALLADDPGLGKTLQALGAAHQLKAERVLVVCPAGARLVWQREIQRWLPRWNHRTLVIEPGGILIPDIQLRIARSEPLS